MEKNEVLLKVSNTLSWLEEMGASISVRWRIYD